MAKKKVRKSQSQVAYEKQVRRIKQAIYRIRKSGLEVDYQLPPKPTKYTKSAVAKLAKITPSDLRVFSYIPEEPPKFKPRAKKGFKFDKEYGAYVDYSTGEFYYPPERSQLVYQNVETLINRLMQPVPTQIANPNPRAKSGSIITRPAEIVSKQERLQQRLLNALKEQYKADPEGLSDRLQNNAGVVGECVDKLYFAYDDELLDSAFFDLYEIIMDRSMDASEAQDLTDYMDYEYGSGESYEG